MKYAKYKGFTVNVLNITIRNMEMNWLKLCHMTNNRNMLYHQGTHTASIRVRLQLMHLCIRKNETVFYEKWQTITKLNTYSSKLVDNNWLWRTYSCWQNRRLHSWIQVEQQLVFPQRSHQQIFH